MTNKIEGLTPHAVGPGSGRRTEPVRAVDASAPPKKAIAAEDQVTLTGASRQLQHLSEAVAAAPDVSTRRVEALRALIEKGHYEVDARRIADRLIDFERELAGR
ncbi:MAG TPA: flagellar biosynthesis anti-sigma factor FlgM [Steroidobacteraceae bacterium]|nr:flagellar biosynthesis anti-sigma factor FlgM [Steroidobacteraceae bacterium]